MTLFYRTYFSPKALLTALLFALSTLANSEDDVVRLQGFSIQGSSEEPHVLYITPWRPPPGTGRLYQPIFSYRDHWLQPLDRSSLRQEVRYAERYLPKQVNHERLRQLSKKTPEADLNALRDASGPQSSNVTGQQ